MPGHGRFSHWARGHVMSLSFGNMRYRSPSSHHPHGTLSGSGERAVRRLRGVRILNIVILSIDKPPLVITMLDLTQWIAGKDDLLSHNPLAKTDDAMKWRQRYSWRILKLSLLAFSARFLLVFLILGAIYFILLSISLGDSSFGRSFTVTVGLMTGSDPMSLVGVDGVDVNRATWIGAWIIHFVGWLFVPALVGYLVSQVVVKLEERLAQVESELEKADERLAQVQAEQRMPEETARNLLDAATSLQFAASDTSRTLSDVRRSLVDLIGPTHDLRQLSTAVETFVRNQEETTTQLGSLASALHYQQQQLAELVDLMKQSERQKQRILNAVNEAS